MLAFNLALFIMNCAFYYFERNLIYLVNLCSALHNSQLYYPRILLNPINCMMIDQENLKPIQSSNHILEEINYKSRECNKKLNLIDLIDTHTGTGIDATPYCDVTPLHCTFFVSTHYTTFFYIILHYIITL